MKNDQIEIQSVCRGSTNYKLAEIPKDSLIQFKRGDHIDIILNLPSNKTYYHGLSEQTWSEIAENEKPTPFDVEVSPYNIDKDNTIVMGQIPFITYMQN